MNKFIKSILPKRDAAATTSSFTPATPGEGNGSDSYHSTPQDILLTLGHLRKIFNECQRPKLQWSQEEKNERLYSTIPMVIKVLTVLSNNEWEERFPELPEYALTLAKLLVSEVRLRADKEPNSSAASQAIVGYLELADENSSMSGWSLLHVLKLLSSGPNFILDKFAQASLPSTLVKCLYLFFDLPEITSSQSTSDGISAKEKRILLQQIFFQVTSPDDRRLARSPRSFSFCHVLPSRTPAWKNSLDVTIYRCCSTPSPAIVLRVTKSGETRRRTCSSSSASTRCSQPCNAYTVTESTRGAMREDDRACRSCRWQAHRRVRGPLAARDVRPVARGNGARVRNVGLRADRIDLVHDQPAGRLSSRALLRACEGYHSEVILDCQREADQRERGVR